jgi:hypothetical protein
LLISRILAALLALSPAQGAFAWGPEGHRTVAEIASRYLDPKASARVLELLEDDRLADGELSGRRTLGEVASWADEIREYDPKRPGRRLHFDDIPLCETPDYARYCKNGQCASAQIDRQLRILSDGSARLPLRNRALKWVVHLVGDIHQPLHAADRRDRGGNTVQVSFFGQRDNPPYGSLNLHAVWDVHILRRLLAGRGGVRVFVSAPLMERDKAAWEKGSISDWIAESHAIARDFAYAALPVPASCPHKIAGVVALEEAYYDQAAPVIEVQIRKAGVRLARVLNQALGR